MLEFMRLNWGWMLSFVTVLGGLFGLLLKQQVALKRGVQALLRAQMVSDYNKFKEKGFAPLYAKQNFENCWTQYHSLGANGVMENIRKEFMMLPTLPPTGAQG